MVQESLGFNIRMETNVLFVISLILLIIAASGPVPWLAWGALQLAVLGQFVLDRDRTSLKKSLRRGTPQLVASILLAVGFWVGLESADRWIHQIGVILTIVGVGGLLGWFPLPQGRGRNVVNERLSDQLVTTLIPVAIVALLLYRCVQQGNWSEAELAMLAVVSLFTLALCGVRLMGELTVERRCRLSMLTILSNANLASVLSGWELLHPDRAWLATSNLPSGQELFCSILVVETLAALVILMSFCTLFRDTESSHPESSLSGIFRRNSIIGGSLLFGVFTLAGLPPLAGAWWRFAFLSSMLLPQERSVVTTLPEPHPGFITLGITYAAITLIVALVHLRLIRVMTLDPPMDSPHPKKSPTHSTLIYVCLILLMLVSFMPVAFPTILLSLLS